MLSGQGVARRRFGARRSLIIFAGLDQLGVNRGPKLLVACFPLLLVHIKPWGGVGVRCAAAKAVLPLVYNKVVWGLAQDKVR